MPMRTTIAAVIASAVIAACGGGGSNDTPAAPGSIKGTFSALSGSVTPDPATTAQALDVRATMQFNGQFLPAAPTVAIPCVITVDGAPAGVVCAVTFRRVSGQDGTGTHTGTLSLTLPALRQVGRHEVCVTLDPAAWGTWDGTTDGESCAPVDVITP